MDDRKDRLQILVLGSDTRSGKNGQYGTVDQSSGYGQSDVMMLLDISADNNHVNVISFPRDLLDDVPACTDHTTNQQHDAHQNVMINSAMAEAGIGCAVDTVNRLTGLEVDHFRSRGTRPWRSSAPAMPSPMAETLAGSRPSRHSSPP